MPGMLKTLRYQLRVFLRMNIVAFFSMVLFFFIGVVCGALAIKVLPEGQKAELVSYLHLFFSGLSQGAVISRPELLWETLAHNVKIILFMWLLGFTIVGIPFVVFLVFTRGFIIGFTVGFLVNEYVMRGLLFAVVAVLPHNLFAVPAVLLTAVAATGFSWMLLHRSRRGRRSLMIDGLSYSFLCWGMLAVMAAASVIEVYISPVFMKLIAGFLLGA